MNVREALASVNERITRAAAACGRDPRTIALVAVSKTHPAAMIREAYAAGQRVFGESYAQELATKAAELADLPDIAWHFIGHLQTNKVKVVAPIATSVHSVDSVHLVRELARRRASANVSRPLDVLVEVNVAGETQKSGVAPSELEEVLAAVAGEPSLALRGLMTMPPLGALDVAKRTFETLVSLRNLHGGVARLPELSMGMSSDLEVAIAAGATYVRIGTAIFGER